jgi:hypothetical protein
MGNSMTIGKRRPPIKQPKYDRNSFIKAAVEVHGDLYDYSLIERPILSQKITIICKIHGPFNQKGQHHLLGSGCNMCGIANRSGSAAAWHKKAQHNFIAPTWAPDAKLLIRDKVAFTCQNHGSRLVSKYRFLRMSECDICSEERKLSRFTDWEKYKYRVRQITERMWKQYNGFINHYGVTRGRSTYHIDHQVSIKEGFDLNIPPEIIEHWTNLHLKPAKENISKNSKSEKDIELLIATYYWAIRKFGR